MKTILILLACTTVTVCAFADEIIVQRIQGDVSVRHGVTEVWSTVSVGDVLRPDDTMKTGKRGSAILTARLESKEEGVTTKRITLPAEVMVDMSDVRNLSQEELMLKLTMEKVRASSYQWKGDDPQIPNATVVHGTDQTPSAPMSENDVQVGLFQLNGTKVLFENGFYSTCALKTMEVFRLFPSLGERVDSRLMLARVLESANLRGEALSEYSLLARREGLAPDQQDLVRKKIAQLRK